MLQELGAGSIQTTFFDGSNPTFKAVLQTSWAELESQGLVIRSSGSKYRLTAHGWLVALEAAGARQSQEFFRKVSKILAALKRCVKGRVGSAAGDYGRDSK